MSEERKVPAIRFEGCTDDWEQRRLGDMMNVTSVKRIHQSDWTDSGIRFLRARDIVAASKGEEPSDYLYITKEKYEEYSAISGKVEIDDLLVTGVGTIGVPYLISNSEPIYFKDGNIIWFQNVGKINGKFFYYSFTGQMIQSFIQDSAGIGTVGTYTIESGKKTPILLPSVEEQKMVGTFFANLDTLITLHQRKYDKLVKVKKSMLEKMFPKGDAKVPEIRFAGFADDWEQRRLGDVVTEYTDPVPTPHEGYERLGIRSHGKGTFHNYVGAGHELETAQMHRVAANKLIVNITFAWEHAVAVTDENDVGKLVSHRFPQFSLSEAIDPGFLQYLILDDDFRHHLWLASPGGAGRNRVLKIPEMLEYKIIIPIVAEQKKIAATLNELNTLITLHHRKLEKLKTIKSAMLEKMFV